MFNSNNNTTEKRQLERDHDNEDHRHLNAGPTSRDINSFVRPRSRRSPTTTEEELSALKIERGIPVPPRDYSDFSNGKGQGKWQIILREMRSGDSVVLPCAQANALATSGRKGGHNMVVRKVNKKFKRVWKL